MLDNLDSKQKKIVIIVAITVAMGVIYFIYNHVGTDKVLLDENMLVENANTTKNVVATKETEEEIVVIHITGAVKTPGIVKLQAGSRIEDAIEKAGGLTEDADISKINLAYILEDGTKITIPKEADVEGLAQEEIMTNESGENVIEETNTSSNSNSQNININKATEAELKTLPRDWTFTCHKNNFL